MEGELNYTDTLTFPEEIKIVEINGNYLVISVSTANWIVLKNAMQLRLFNMLTDKCEIGTIIESLENEEDIYHLQSLLAAIFARKFACVDKLPEVSYLEGHRMLNIYLTNACNLRCKHCFMHSGKRLDNELSAHEWKSILKEFYANGGKAVTFTGGEPLLFADFLEVLKYAHEIGLSTTVLSNGTLWSDDSVKSFSPYIDEIQFSLDGFDEESNALIRGENHYSSVVNSILKFANGGVKTSVATTFTYDNLNDETAIKYKELVKCIQSQVKSEVFFKLSKKLLPGRNVLLSNAENKKYAEQIKSIEHEVNPHADAENFIVGHEPNLISTNCGFGGLSITADGNVCFCNRVSEVESFGHISDKPLKEYMDLGIKIHKDTSVDHVEPCASCMLRYICNGGCRIDDFNFHGKIKEAPEQYIQINCTEESRQRLMERMVDSFNYMYDFDLCSTD